MNMIVPSFFLFAIYAGVNVWFPLFLRTMGYSVVHVGLLLSIFEIFGVLVPFFTGNIPAKSGKYGLFLFVNGSMLALIPVALFSIPVFAVSALCLALYAASLKAVIPVSDTFINLQLGTKSYLYGRIRAVGSFGFVAANIVMQVCIRVDSISVFETVVWVSVPALLFSLSLLVIPGIMRPIRFSPSEINLRVQSGNKVQKEKSAVCGLCKRFSSHYWLVLTVIFLTIFGQIPTGRFFSMYVKEYLHSDAAGFLWILSALSEIPFMIFSNRFIRRWGCLKLILFCAAVSSLRNLIYVVFPSVAGAAAAQLLNSFTFGIFHPAAVMFAARQVRNKEQLVLSQLLYSVGAIGTASILASALGGFVIARFGYPFLFVLYAAFPLAGIVLFFICNKKLKKC